MIWSRGIKHPSNREDKGRHRHLTSNYTQESGGVGKEDWVGLRPSEIRPDTLCEKQGRHRSGGTTRPPRGDNPTKPNR